MELNRTTLWSAVAGLLVTGVLVARAPAGSPGQESTGGEFAPADVQALFSKAGIQLDAPNEALAFPAAVEVRGDALEYMLVNGHGAVHESLLVTNVDAEVLAAAFLAAGAEPGTNVQYVERDPMPTQDEIRAGARTHDVVPPTGKPLYFHVAWREASGDPDGRETVYMHRLEDLVLDLERDRTMRRHGMVWLGSRIVPGRGDAVPPQFAAQVTGNLASVTFFSEGDALFTTALEECTSQTNWYPNGWLLPQQGGEVLCIASHTPLVTVPDAFRAALPLVVETRDDSGGNGR